MHGSFEGFAGGFLVGAAVILGAFLLADAIANKFSEEVKRSTIQLRIGAGAVLLGLTGASRVLHLDKASAMLLLLVPIFLFARTNGFVDALGMTALSVGLLAFWFLPPVGSWYINDPSDRVSLGLFIGSALFGSNLMRGRTKVLL